MLERRESRGLVGILDLRLKRVWMGNPRHLTVGAVIVRPLGGGAGAYEQLARHPATPRASDQPRPSKPVPHKFSQRDRKTTSVADEKTRCCLGTPEVA